MIFGNRALVRAGAGAVGLLAAGALAAPAFASGTETDLSLDVVGTRVASNAEGKIGFAKVTNKGKGTPTSLVIQADVSKVDFDKVIALPVMDDCDFEGDAKPVKWSCTVPSDLIPGPGETADLPVALFKLEKLTEAYSAEVTFSIASPDDTDESNNSQTKQIEFTRLKGPDLLVLAGDVKQAITVGSDGKIEFDGELNPGESAALQYFAVNQGDIATTGLKVTVKLPKGVTFSEVEENCEYADDKASLVCTYKNLPFVPVAEDTNDGDEVYSGGDFYHLISVSGDATAPSSLTGGTVTVEPIVSDGGGKPRTATPASHPKHFKGIQSEDIDPSDNTDGFSVILAGTDGGGGGGGLPVTGVQAGVIGGVGAAVVAAGVGMFLMARRRRVVLVTPGDEKSTN